MGTVATDRWLNKFILQSKDDEINKLQLQLQTIIIPMIKSFPNENPLMLHRFLLNHGLFNPEQNIANDLYNMKQKDMWKNAQILHNKLKKKWNGPETKIFLFPLDNKNEKHYRELGQKTGICFGGNVVLFVSGQIEKRALQSLLIHEYNHICRLHILKKPFDRLTLLDSVIIEGLAEVAVEKLLGSTYLATWATMYTKKQAIDLWIKYFKSDYQLEGKQHHFPYLFGSHSIPRWSGYSIGYYLVKDAVLKRAYTTEKLLACTSEEILELSDFAK